MPLIKRKPVEVIPPPEAEDYAEDQPVFYLKATGEIFLEYEDYIQRLTFYRQRLFQCELSGKINLTYFEAAKSERQQSAAVHRQFPEALKGPILKSVQFLVTGRIDNLVDLVYDRFKNRYFPDERLIVDITGDKYFARVRGVFPHRSLLRRHQEAANTRLAQEKQASSSTLKREGSDSESELSDAPPLDEPETKSKAEVPVEEVIHAYGTDLNRDLSEVNKIDDPNDYIYAIQLEAPDGSSDFSNTLMEKRADSFSRDRLSFSKTILKKYIKECVTRDASIGSPWIVRSVLAQRYGIPISPPAEVIRKNDLIREGKLSKRRKVLPEEDADGKPRKKKKGKVELTEEELKAQADRERELAEEEEKKKAEERRKKMIKYPIDDLSLDPISDRELKAKTRNPDDAPRRRDRPVPSKDLLPAPKDIFEIFMNSYLFLQACGKPLALSPFTLDDFEAALRHQTHDPACHLISEIHGTLINAIVRENTNVKPPPALTAAGSKGGSKVASALPSDEEEFDEEANETEEEEEEEIDELDSGASSIADTSVGDSAEDLDTEMKDEEIDTRENGIENEEVQIEDVFAASRKYGRGWEKKVLRNEHFRDGWEYSLCGVLSKRADAARFPRLLPILSQLSGVGNYTLLEEDDHQTKVEEAESKKATAGTAELYRTPVHRYTTLSFRDKISIIYFLCEQAVMSKGVKAFFDECEHNLTELRKEKIDLSRARKKLAEDRAVFEGGTKKEDEEEAIKENGFDLKENGQEASDADEEAEEMEEVESAGEEDELESSPEVDEEYESEANDSVATDEQKPARRSLGSRQEALRERAIQREAEEAQRAADLAKAREEHKARLLENKQIASERKKLDDEELRIIRREEAIEREFRQYSQAPRLAPLGRDRYLDKYWWFDGVGLGPLVNQWSQVMYSTGRLFVQGASAEEWSICSSNYEKGTRSLNERRKKEQTEEGILKPDEWAVYTESEQIEELMAWLRAKGNRENALRSQINKFKYYLAPGMQKRNHDLTGGWKDNVETRRSNRSKEGATTRLPYMMYRNALAKGRD